MTTQQPSGRWNSLQKISFRFIFVFFLTHIIQWDLVDGLLDGITKWTGSHILHIPYPITVKPNGSGDTTFNYVQEFMFLTVSIVSCILWSILDRKRTEYEKLYYWLTVLVRYYLAVVLLLYGFAKIFKSQFPAPDELRLTETYGDSSPMGLAWTFFGYSTAFNIFMGFFESIGGVLMLFRRTTLFGACIAATVVTNIVLINFCYDVPVKLFSCSLLLMTLFLIAGDLQRFLNFFILNKPVQAKDYTPIFKKKNWKITRLAIKGLFICSAIGFGAYECWQESNDFGNDATKPALFGNYRVETFVRNNDTLPSLTTDSVRWSKVMVAYGNSMKITKMNDSAKWYKISVFPAEHRAMITRFRDSSLANNFSYTQPDSSTLIMAGKWKDDSLFVKMKIEDNKHFLLMNRGFHWINEYPVNR